LTKNGERVDRHAAVKGLANKGMTNEAIAENLGLSLATVAQYKKKSLIAPGVPMSVREQQVSDLSGEGLTSEAIGQQLGMSPKTVELHRFRAMKKLGVNSAVELVALYKREERDKLNGEITTLKTQVAQLEKQLAELLNKLNVRALH
jgi:DNA-binding NarL/FixJ family response regulator